MDKLLDFGFGSSNSIVALIIFLFYIPFIYISFLTLIKQTARKKFYRAVMTILERNTDDGECVPEIFTAYKKLVEKNPSIKNSDRSAVDIVEDLLYRADSSTPNRFKENYGVEIVQENRKRINNIIVLMKQNEPFASVSSKYSGQLNMLKHALSTNNQDLGKSMLNQLADDVEIMERTIYAQQRINIASIIVSIVGVVLTIIFGFISILPFLQSK